MTRAGGARSHANTRPTVFRPRLDDWRYVCLLYVFLAGVVHLPGLGATGLVGLEAMAATTAERMLDGGDLIVPQLYGEIYTYKPPLLYWLLALSIGVFGHADWVVRLPGVTLSTLAGLAVLWLVGRVTRPRVGLYAASATITGFLWMQKSRQGDFDIVLASFVGIAVAASCHNLVADRRRASPTIWLIAYLAFAAAFLTKGMPAVMAFAPGLLVAAVLSGRAGRLLERKHLLPAATAVALIASYLYALWSVAGPAVLDQPLAEAQRRGFEWTLASLGRTLLKPLDIFAAFMPWSIAWLWALPTSRPRSEPPSPIDRLGLAASGFLVTGMIAFMMVPTAHTRYYLPLAVPAALFGGVGLARLGEPSRGASLLLRGTVATFALAALALALAPLAAPYSPLSLTLVGAASLLGLSRSRVVPARHRAAYLLLVAALCAWAVEMTALRPHRARHRDLVEVARVMDRQLPSGVTVWAPGSEADIVGRNGSLFYYLRRPVRVFGFDEPLPPAGSFVVLEEDDRSRLETVSSGRLARLELLRSTPHPAGDFLLYRVGPVAGASARAR